jgi:hypothetical protein
MANVYTVIRNSSDDAFVEVSTFSTKAKATKFIKESVEQDNNNLLSIPIDKNDIRIDMDNEVSIVSAYDVTIIYQLEKTVLE